MKEDENKMIPIGNCRMKFKALKAGLMTCNGYSVKGGSSISIHFLTVTLTSGSGKKNSSLDCTAGSCQYCNSQ